MKFNSYTLRPNGDGDPRIFPRGSSYNEDNWGPEVIPGRGDVLQLTPQNFGRWETFIAREGHLAVMESGGRILIDGAPATAYTVRRNYYFGMGDNRDNSLDSRFWGFIPEDEIIGTPLIVYWSWNPDLPVSKFSDKISSIRIRTLRLAGALSGALRYLRIPAQMMKKSTQESSKLHNSRLVLRTIYRQGEISRVEVARQTGLTRTTVSEVVGRFIQEGRR